MVKVRYIFTTGGKDSSAVKLYNLKPFSPYYVVFGKSKDRIYIRVRRICGLNLYNLDTLQKIHTEIF